MSNDSKIADESASLLLNISPAKQHSLVEQQLELQQKIHKQRQEQRLIREKNLIEFKNQRLKDEQKRRDVDSIIQSHMQSQLEIPRNLTLQDKCAIKIQAAWRGYYTRQSKKCQMFRYKKLSNTTQCLRAMLDKLVADHRNLVEFNTESTAGIVSIVSFLFNFYFSHQLCLFAILVEQLLEYSSNYNI
jgi:hypothetical protein